MTPISTIAVQPKTSHKKELHYAKYYIGQPIGKVDELMKLDSKIEKISTNIARTKRNTDNAIQSDKESPFVSGTGSDLLNNASNNAGPIGAIIILGVNLITNYKGFSSWQRIAVLVSLAFIVCGFAASKFFAARQSTLVNRINQNKRISFQMAKDEKIINALKLLVDGAMLFIKEDNPKECYTKLIELRNTIVETRPDYVFNRFPYMLGKIEEVLKRSDAKDELSNEDQAYLDKFFDTEYIPALRARIDEIKLRIANLQGGGGDGGLSSQPSDPQVDDSPV